MERLFAWLLVFVGVLTVSGYGTEAEENAVDWDSLSFFDSDLDRSEFERVVSDIFAPYGGWETFVRVEDAGVWVSTSSEKAEDVFMPFASIRIFSEGAESESRGLEGLKIALDPGHIGGVWGAMEERAISVFGNEPVQEGDLTLATALRLRDRLESLGAIVWLTRETSEPVTPLRPADFLEEAKAYHANDIGVSDEELQESIRERSEILFYRKAEIEARAERLNSEFKPDLTLALHYNAEGWVDPENPVLVESNNAHVLVHGSYLAGELVREDMRFQFLKHIARQHYKIEIPLAEAIAESMVEITGLEPYHYGSENAKRLGESKYVWSRNLLANRIFDCPVVYLEPWILNSVTIYPWAREGEYEGTRMIEGVERKSLPAVYSDFVVNGLLSFYGHSEGK